MRERIQIGLVLGERFTNWRGWDTERSASVSISGGLIMLDTGHADGNCALSPEGAITLAGLLNMAAVKVKHSPKKDDSK